MSGFLRWIGSDAIVAFGSALQVEFVEAVVDLDEAGEILRVEILGLTERHPALNTTEGTRTSPRISVDPDADAVYIRLGLGRSVDQVVRIAAVAFDPADRLVALTVRMEPWVSKPRRCMFRLGLSEFLFDGTVYDGIPRAPAPGRLLPIANCQLPIANCGPSAARPSQYSANSRARSMMPSTDGYTCSSSDEE